MFDMQIVNGIISKDKYCGEYTCQTKKGRAQLIM